MASVKLFLLMAVIVTIASSNSFEEELLRMKVDNSLFLPEYALPTSSGYFKITEESKMHFAYYEAFATNVTSETPIILWLQGGPGCSGAIGNFYELGRWRITEDLQLEENLGAWNRKYGVLFVDNPIGTGFSVAADKDLVKDQQTVALHLYSALTQFFDNNPSFRVRPFFVAGESYAGKYVPSLCYHILQAFDQIDGATARSKLTTKLRGSVTENPSRPFRLDGLVIGNGFTDPEVMITAHADAAYQAGLIDFKQKAVVDEIASKAVDFIHAEQWEQAADARLELVAYIEKVSGLSTMLDIRRDVRYDHNSDNEEFLRFFLNSNQVKAALNVLPEVNWVACNSRPRNALKIDTMKSSKWAIEYLIHRLPILLFQGAFDIKDGVASTEKWLRTMKWEHVDSFFGSPRDIWRVEGQVAGYWRSHEGLTNVVVRGAGHEASADQSVRTQNMIEKWVDEQLSAVKQA